MNQNAKGIKKFLYDAKTFSPLLFNLVSKDFKIKYRRSVLGVLWSVLNPLLTMLVISQVFGILLKVSIDHFAAYYIVGATIWNFFSEATTLSMSSILAGASLIKKVYIPKYIFPLEKCLFALINMAFSMIAVVAVMLFQGVFPTWAILLAPVAVFYCFVFSVGMSLILSALTVYFRDIQHLYGVLLTVWMYLTPIIYPMELIEGNDILNTIVHCNPLYYFVDYFRDVMMLGANTADSVMYTLPTVADNLICFGIALVTLLLGCLIFSKAQKRFILHI